jgi:hypothetical protein
MNALTEVPNEKIYLRDAGLL